MVRILIFLQPKFPHHFFLGTGIHSHFPVPSPSRKSPSPDSSIRSVASRHDTFVLHTFELSVKIQPGIPISKNLKFDFRQRKTHHSASFNRVLRPVIDQNLNVVYGPMLFLLLRDSESAFISFGEFLRDLI